MWKEKCVYVLNYVKSFKAIHKSNSRTRSQQENKKKNCAEDSCLFQSLYCCKIAGTIMVLCYPLFTKKCVNGIKQRMWTPLLNSAYSNWSRYQISL